MCPYLTTNLTFYRVGVSLRRSIVILICTWVKYWVGTVKTEMRTLYFWITSEFKDKRLHVLLKYFDGFLTFVVSVDSWQHTWGGFFFLQTGRFPYNESLHFLYRELSSCCRLRVSVMRFTFQREFSHFWPVQVLYFSIFSVSMSLCFV